MPQQKHIIRGGRSLPIDESGNVAEIPVPPGSIVIRCHGIWSASFAGLPGFEATGDSPHAALAALDQAVRDRGVNGLAQAALSVAEAVE